jgi:cysteine synthase A
MSQERFAWLREIGAEVIATPGCESNVKEIYDQCWEIRRTRPDCVIFNQFEEFGNPIWHYHVTGAIIEEIYEQIRGSATGSRGMCPPPGQRGPSQPVTTCVPCFRG